MTSVRVIMQKAAQEDLIPKNPPKFFLIITCGNPIPTPWARRPRGKVVDGVYRPYPPASTSAHCAISAMENTCGGGREEQVTF